jgi:hypothetical protein
LKRDLSPSYLHPRAAGRLFGPKDIEPWISHAAKVHGDGQLAKPPEAFKIAELDILVILSLCNVPAVKGLRDRRCSDLDRSKVEV